jgi:hypothetical protein
MLAIPNEGMNRSVNAHNIDRDILCDWIEANVVLQESRLSKSDVVDALTDNGVYENQDMANEIVEEAWTVLQNRVNYLKNPLGITIADDRITRNSRWTDFPAYAFCLVLACAKAYPDWAKKWNNPKPTHGELFEELAFESLSASFPGWKVTRMGWTPSNPIKLKKVIHQIIRDLCEKQGPDLDLHVTNSTNELGLDLLAYYPYDDSRSSFPVMMIQCASGKHWEEKKHTPDIETWKRIIAFNLTPVRGMAIPFAFADHNEFRKLAASVNGVFLERSRLIGAFSRSSCGVSQSLTKKLVTWTKRQIRSMPTDAI